MTRPNIVYFHSHDTGRYVQPYGYAVPTPNYQRLAEGGVLFRQAFSAAPTCSPSRAALLTGQSPHAAGMLGLAHRGFALNDPTQHLAATLRNAGYRTMLAGVQHVTRGDPAELGYTDVSNRESGDPNLDQIVAVATAWIEQADGPFFLDTGFFETHRVFPEVEPQAARYVRPPAPLPDTPETRLDMARYIESARRLDGALGAILDALDATGHAGDTIVVCTTDHGLAFPEMKCNLTDHGTGVLLIMRGPGTGEAGRVIDSMVSHVDLYPTLCDLVGIDRPAWLTGTSLVPLLDGRGGKVNDAVFAEVTYHAAYDPQRMVRTPRWSYIRRYGDRARPALPNTDGGESREILLANGWQDQERPFEHLYDNLLDPIQRRNRIGDPACEDVRADMRQRLDTWMRQTHDPLLDGPVPLPVGGRANDPDGFSALQDVYEMLSDGSLARRA